MREIEPKVAGVRGLHVPPTGIIDWRRSRWCSPMPAGTRRRDPDRGGGHGIRRWDGGLVLESTGGAVASRNLVTCAGLWSDRLAAMTSHAWNADRPVPWRLRGSPAGGTTLRRTLIYPVPDPRYPFLGVHLTHADRRRGMGGPECGPRLRARGVPAPRRRPPGNRGVVGLSRVPRLARRTGGPAPPRWGVTGVGGLRRGNPGATFPQTGSVDIGRGPYGIRAQALRRDGTLVEDFAIGGGGTCSTSRMRLAGGYREPGDRP